MVSPAASLGSRKAAASMICVTMELARADCGALKVNSVSPNAETSPLCSFTSEMRSPLTKVPFVLSRSSIE